MHRRQLGDADAACQPLVYGRRISHGLEASRQAAITLHDFGRLNALLDAGVAAGLSKVENVTFASSHTDALRRQARDKAAAADARARTADLAKAFGATLGPVHSIDAVNSYRSSSYGGQSSLDRDEVTGSRINTGRYLQPTVEYSEQGSIVFELKRP